MKGGMRGSYFRRMYLMALVDLPFDLERPNSAGQHVGRAYRGSANPHHNGAGLQCSPFWGSLLFLHTPFIAELPNLTW